MTQEIPTESPNSPHFLVVNERLITNNNIFHERINSQVTESRKNSSTMGRSEYNSHSPNYKRNIDIVSEMGEHDLSMTLKRIENYVDTTPSELVNPLDDFKKSFWRNEPESPE